MKLAFFHLVACVVVGVVCDQEAEKPVELNTFEKFILWLDPEVHVGDECVVGIVCYTLFFSCLSMTVRSLVADTSRSISLVCVRR